MTLLSLKNLCVNRGGRLVVDDISLEIGAGEVVGLVGPNGAGKTTLMRASLGLLPASGHSSLASLPARDRARAVAWLPQSREIAWPVPVETVVALGRSSYLAGGRRLSVQDHEAIGRAMELMDVRSFAARPATELSGGEQARVLIARALAQNTPLVLADEPGAGLDPAHQFTLMRVFKALAAEGRSVFVSLHDLGLAAGHCTRIVMLANGKIAADGPPRKVLTPEKLSAVFGVSGHWLDLPGTAGLHVTESVNA